MPGLEERLSVTGQQAARLPGLQHEIERLQRQVDGADKLQLQLDAANTQKTSDAKDSKKVRETLAATEKQLNAANRQKVSDAEELKEIRETLGATKEQLDAANRQKDSDAEELRGVRETLGATKEQLVEVSELKRSLQVASEHETEANNRAEEERLEKQRLGTKLEEASRKAREEREDLRSQVSGIFELQEQLRVAQLEVRRLQAAASTATPHATQQSPSTVYRGRQEPPHIRLKRRRRDRATGSFETARRSPVLPSPPRSKGLPWPNLRSREHSPRVSMA